MTPPLEGGNLLNDIEVVDLEEPTTLVEGVAAGRLQPLSVAEFRIMEIGLLLLLGTVLAPALSPSRPVVLLFWPDLRPANRLSNRASNKRSFSISVFDLGGLGVGLDPALAAWRLGKAALRLGKAVRGRGVTGLGCGAVAGRPDSGAGTLGDDL